MNSPRPEPKFAPKLARNILLRLTLATTLLLPVALSFGTTLVEAWLPIYRPVFGWAVGEFRLVSMQVDSEGADHVIRARVKWREVVRIGEHAMFPDPRGNANASTLLAHALTGPLVALLAACAWPALSRREWAWRTLCLLPALAGLIVLDVPLVLAGELWEMVRDALAPGSASPLVVWKSFMQSGGRLALGLTLGVLAAIAARRCSHQAQ